MTSRSERVQEALTASTRPDMIRALSPRQCDLTLSEINRLTRRLNSFGGVLEPLKIAVLRTYTTELLRPYWKFESLLQGFGLDLYEANYGSLLQELQPNAGLLAHDPHVTFLFLEWDYLSSQKNCPMMALSPEERDEAAVSALEHLVNLLSRFREALQGTIVVTILPRCFGPELGNFDTMAAESEFSFRMNWKVRLAARLRDTLPAVYFCDLDQVVEEVGRLHMFDPRLWYDARFPFSTNAAQAVARRLLGYAVVQKQPKAKCVILDADNTLWGGIIGEEGIGGIALGPNYPGSIYVAFQRRLLEYQERGFLLGLCSKNNSEDVFEVLRRHPHQVLREESFAATRINWVSKADNLRAIADELNLGLESFVFVDDSPYECRSIQEQLPAVTVVQVPRDIVDLPLCLDDLPQLEILSLTKEDRKRTKLYANERQRRELAATSLDLATYLNSLHMVMTVGLNDATCAARISQLSQKANQFNLTTRRYTEADVQEFVRDPDWLVAHFSLTDIFGDSGLVGVALISGLGRKVAEVDSFLMSCRVIGRQAEVAFLHQLFEILSQNEVTRLQARYIPTTKNSLVKAFWYEQGFQLVGPDIYEIDLPQLTFQGSQPIKVQVNGNAARPDLMEKLTTIS